MIWLNFDISKWLQKLPLYLLYNHYNHSTLILLFVLFFLYEIKTFEKGITDLCEVYQWSLIPPVENYTDVRIKSSYKANRRFITRGQYLAFINHKNEENNRYRIWRNSAIIQNRRNVIVQYNSVNNKTFSEKNYCLTLMDLWILFVIFHQRIHLIE